MSCAGDLIKEEVKETLDELNAPTIDKAKLGKELADILYVVYGAADMFRNTTGR